MEVTYALSVNDVVQFDRFLIRRSHALQAGLALMILLVPVIFGAIWFSQPQTWTGALTGAGISLAIGIVWALLILTGRAGSIRQRNAKIVGLKTARLYPDGIFVAAELVETKYKWIGITEITENPRYLFLLLGPLTAIIIPKEAFGSSEQAAAFLSNARAFWMNLRQGTNLPLVENDATTWPPPPRRA